MQKNLPLRNFLLITGAVLFLGSVPATGSPATLFQGTVMDGSGQPLGQVQVFLGSVGREVLSSRTDGQGGFRFDAVAPGRYTLLAMKNGYHATFSQVNTMVQSSLDMTLRVLGEPASEPLAAKRKPRDRSWILRLPERDLLRELDHDAVLMSTNQPQSESTGGVFDTEVMQWFSMGWGGQVRSAGQGGDGWNTEAVLTSTGSPTFSWDLSGRLEREATQFSSQELQAQSVESQQIEMGLRLAAGAKHEFDFSGFFANTERGFELADASQPPGQRDSQIWSYDTRWRARIADGSDLDLQLGYGSAQADGSLGAASPSTLRDQQWRALGSYSFSPAPGHNLRLGMRADVYRFGDREQRLTLAPMLGPASLVGSGDQGWTLNVFGRETFAVTEPLALEVGFDYQRLGFDQGLSYLTPQAGIRYRVAPRQTMRALVLMRFTDFSSAHGESEEDLSPGSRSVRRVGYLLGWEGEFGQDMSLAVAAMVRPFTGQLGLEDASVYRSVGGAAFASDGQASEREVSFRLEKSLKLLRGSTGVRFGDVEGNFISFMPSELPTQRMSQNLARFVSTSVQTSILPTGTHIAVDFHWIENQALQLGKPVAVPVTYTSIDMLVQQELKMVPGRWDWKVLLGYQQITNRSDDGAELSMAQLGIAENVRRVRGGVSVSF